MKVIRAMANLKSLNLFNFISNSKDFVKKFNKVIILSYEKSLNIYGEQLILWSAICKIFSSIPILYCK